MLLYVQRQKLQIGLRHTVLRERAVIKERPVFHGHYLPLILHTQPLSLWRFYLWLLRLSRCLDWSPKISGQDAHKNDCHSYDTRRWWMADASRIQVPKLFGALKQACRLCLAVRTRVHF